MFHVKHINVVKILISKNVSRETFLLNFNKVIIFLYKGKVKSNVSRETFAHFDANNTLML